MKTIDIFLTVNLTNVHIPKISTSLYSQNFKTKELKIVRNGGT